jgi:hypothetical protein
MRRLLSRPDLPDGMPGNLAEESRKVLDTFDRIRVARDEFSETPVETFVLSMAHHASDVLCVQLLAWRAGLLEVDANGTCTANHLGVTPLFETVDDLGRAGRPRRCGACSKTLLPFVSLARRRPPGDHARLQRLCQRRRLRREQLNAV